MSIATADLYEAAYYLVNGCELVEITATPAGKEMRCRMSFSGESIEHLQVSYLHGHAAANLFQFRRAYNELSAALIRAKKQAKHELSAARTNGGRR